MKTYKEAAELWPLYQPYIDDLDKPRASRRGRRQISNYQVFTALFWFLRSGASWRVWPPDWGVSARTAQRRWARWRDAGIFSKVLADVARPAGETEHCFIDSTFIRGRGCSESGLTRHGKGVVLQVITGWDSMPLAFSIHPAGPAEFARVPATLDGWLSGDASPDNMVGDRGFRGRKHIEALAQQGIGFFSPLNKRDRKPNGSDLDLAPLYQERWRVERLFAWLAGYRRLNACRERTINNFTTWVELALTHVLHRRMNFGDTL